MTHGCDLHFKRGTSTTFYVQLFVCSLLSESLTQEEKRDIAEFTQCQPTSMGTDNKTMQPRIFTQLKIACRPQPFVSFLVM